MTRLLTIGTGYLVAIVAAVATVEVVHRGLHPARVVATHGVNPFGDFFLFFPVAGVLAVPPTWLLFHDLRAHGRRWDRPALIAVIIATTGPLAALLRAAPGFQGADAAYAVLPFLRVLIAVPLLAADLLAWRHAPTELARKRLSFAAILELIAAASLLPLVLGAK